SSDLLDRLQLMRKCGEDFVRRRDAFQRSFDRQWKLPDQELEALNECGLALRERYGFPDETCPDDSPMSEFDAVRSAFFQRRAPADRKEGATATGDAVSVGAREAASAADAPAAASGTH